MTSAAEGSLNPESGSSTEPTAESLSQLSDADLIGRLREDQIWLLRQLDAGRWPEWRLDLAALERELGQLLDQLAERQS